MSSFTKDESRLYNYVLEVINQVMDNYGYDYEMGNNNLDKYYRNDLKNIIVTCNKDSVLHEAELISLGYYLFKRLGLEDIEVYINKNDEVCNLLDILDVLYLSNIDSDNLIYKYVIDDKIVGCGNSKEFSLDIKMLIDTLMVNINREALNRIIDVNIKGSSEEECYHALKIAQDLRLNNINTMINGVEDGKFGIILNEDDLKKGIISVKDNHLNEIVKIDEAEIVDYLLGNI